MKKQNADNTTPSYKFMLADGLSDAYKQMNLQDLSAYEPGEVPLFINLDDAFALSETSAGFRPAYLERLLTLIDAQAEHSICYIKYGAFDWKSDYNQSALSALIELVEYIQNTHATLDVRFILPENKPYVEPRITRALACDLLQIENERSVAA